MTIEKTTVILTEPGLAEVEVVVFADGSVVLSEFGTGLPGGRSISLSAGNLDFIQQLSYLAVEYGGDSE